MGFSLRLVWPGLLCASACAPALFFGSGCTPAPRSPFMGDDQYLRVGVDPDAEARAAIERFERQRQHLYRKVLGKHFVALAFADTDERPTAVRVFTRAGVALSVDSERGLGGGFEYGLFPLPGVAPDADGDGFEEVFLFRQPAGVVGERCVIPYRVRDVGFVDPVLAEVGPLGDDVCIEDVRDLDGDGRVELVARMSLPGPPGDVAASVPCPLWPAHHRFAWNGAPEAAVGFYGGLVAARRARLVGTADDVAEALRLSAEIGMATYLLEGPTAAVEAFEASVAGLTLDAGQQGWVDETRQVLAAPWPGQTHESDENEVPDGTEEAGEPDEPDGTSEAGKPDASGETDAPADAGLPPEARPAAAGEAPHDDT